MALAEEVPVDIGTYLGAFRDKKIRSKNARKLERWIIDMQKVPGFDLKHLVIDGYEYTATDYERLKKRVTRLKKKLSVSAADVLKERESEDFERWVEDAWEQVKTIGKDMVMLFTQRAAELGYYDEKDGKVRMRDFLMDSCNFFVEKRQMIETVEEKIKDLEATCAMFAELSKPQVLRLAALRSYMEFVGVVTQLAAMGVPVPESVILEVRVTVDNVIKSTYLPMRRQST